MNVPSGLPVSGPGYKINNIELPPQRFSVGASAGNTGKQVLQVSSLVGAREMPLPVSVKFRPDLGSVPPGMASKMGLNLGYIGLSPAQKDHYAMLAQNLTMYDSLALIHNDNEHTLAQRY